MDTDQILGVCMIIVALGGFYLALIRPRIEQYEFDRPWDGPKPAMPRRRHMPITTIEHVNIARQRRGLRDLSVMEYQRGINAHTGDVTDLTAWQYLVLMYLQFDNDGNAVVRPDESLTVTDCTFSPGTHEVTMVEMPSNGNEGAVGVGGTVSVGEATGEYTVQVPDMPASLSTGGDL